jgi:hypothetical protein
MLGRGVLSRLHTLTQQNSYTLTLYLDVDQNKQSNRNRGYVVQAEALLKELRARQARSRRLQTAIDQAIELVRRMRPQGKAALVVVHPETELRELHQTSITLAASAHWRRGAFLRPIVEAMDEHERYGVVLTDAKRARLFTVQMGDLTEHDHLLSDTGRRTRALGPDQMRSQKRQDRRREGEVTSHVKRAIDALHELALHAPFDRLIVAGPPKPAGQLVRLLPKRLHGKLVETVSMRVGASTKEVLNKILAVQRRMEREQESALVEGLLHELHEGGKAVTGVMDVVEAVNRGRVWKLFYGKGYKTSGGECRQCGSFAAATVQTCPLCGGAVHRVRQYVDRLSQRVLDMGGQVEVVDGDAAAALGSHGSIAALLRY